MKYRAILADNRYSTIFATGFYGLCIVIYIMALIYTCVQDVPFHIIIFGSAIGAYITAIVAVWKYKINLEMNILAVMIGFIILSILAIIFVLMPLLPVQLLISWMLAQILMAFNCGYRWISLRSIKHGVVKLSKDGLI